MTPAFGGQYSIQLSYGRAMPGAAARRSSSYLPPWPLSSPAAAEGWPFGEGWHFPAQRDAGILLATCAARDPISNNSTVDEVVRVKSSKLMMGCLATLGLSAGLAMAAQAQTDSEREAIAERLKPVGELCLQGEECGSASATAAAPSGNGGAIDGSAIYGNVCMACHETGAAGAPVRGNEEAWASRVEQGFATLLDHSINGFNAMPARGGNPNLSDAEMEAATAYLLEPVMEVPELSSAEAPAEEAPAEEASAASGLDGEALYGSSGCAACHGAGVAGAPVLGDADAWAARLEQGTETLYDHAINGLGAMPPKGGNAGLSDDEVKAIVDYMVAEL